MKLNTGFSPSPGLVFSLGNRSDTTNSSCTMMPPLMPGAAFWTPAEFLFLPLIIGLTKSSRPTIPSKKPFRSQMRYPLLLTLLRTPESTLAFASPVCHLRRILHAYPPSRSFSPTDSCLSDACWEQLQFVFGGTNGHSVDLMAHPSNASTTSLEQNYRFSLRTQSQVAMELTCLVSLPALTHLSFSPTPTFFCPSVSFPMFSVSCFPFASRSQ